LDHNASAERELSPFAQGNRVVGDPHAPNAGHTSVCAPSRECTHL